jgi:hypothetical protein
MRKSGSNSLIRRAARAAAVLSCLAAVWGAQALSAQEATSADAAVQLNGTRWALELQPLYGPALEAPIPDTLRFLEGRMASERLDADGFMEGPVETHTVEGALAWDAKQMSLTSGIVFWHGEIQGATMRGTLSKHPLQGASEDYVFVGRPADVAPVEPGQTTSEPAAPAEAEPAPASEPAPAEADPGPAPDVQADGPSPAS